MGENRKEMEESLRSAAPCTAVGTMKPLDLNESCNGVGKAKTVRTGPFGGVADEQRKRENNGSRNSGLRGCRHSCFGGYALVLFRLSTYPMKEMKQKQCFT